MPMKVREKYDQIPKMEDRIRDLEAWQVAVAEGMGYLNRAEGQDGYEVADPSVIVEAFNAVNFDLFEIAQERDVANGEIEHLKGCNAAVAEERDRMRDRIAALEARLARAERIEEAAKKLLSAVDAVADYCGNIESEQAVDLRCVMYREASLLEDALASTPQTQERAK